MCVFVGRGGIRVEWQQRAKVVRGAPQEPKGYVGKVSARFCLRGLVRRRGEALGATIYRNV